MGRKKRSDRTKPDHWTIKAKSEGFEARSVYKLEEMNKRFQKIDNNGDGLISKDEMIEAHRDRIDKVFMNFDKNGDNKLSKKELSSVRQEMKKRINKVSNEGV